MLKTTSTLPFVWPWGHESSSLPPPLSLMPSFLPSFLLPPSFSSSLPFLLLVSFFLPPLSFPSFHIQHKCTECLGTTFSDGLWDVALSEELTQVHTRTAHKVKSCGSCTGDRGIEIHTVRWCLSKRHHTQDTSIY